MTRSACFFNLFLQVIVPHARAVQVDVDENEDTAGACGVECMPTFQLFKNGEKVGQVEGADEARLRELIKEKNQ